MTNSPISSLSDSELLAETVRAAEAERRSTADLLALLAEVDTRTLYLGRGYSSLFMYCTQVLRFSESAAYARITAARAARDFPIVLTLLSNGAVTLTTVSLLASHLTEENHEALLEAARHKSKREVEYLVARLDPQPDVVSSLRKLPQRLQKAAALPPPMATVAPATSSSAAQALAPVPSAPRRAVVAPCAVDRYLLKVTLSREGHTKLERARDLLRHQIPNGDPAAIVERALAALVDQLEKTKHASTERPRANALAASTSRRVPAVVKHAVWTAMRDDARSSVWTDDAARPAASSSITSSPSRPADPPVSRTSSCGVGRTTCTRQLCPDRVGRYTGREQELVRRVRPKRDDGTFGPSWRPRMSGASTRVRMPERHQHFASPKRRSFCACHRSPRGAGLPVRPAGGR